tara:strand:- start:546 stop:686 length:141 start_codon:yes stop_codon:yes gene_type:complete
MAEYAHAHTEIHTFLPGVSKDVTVEAFDPREGIHNIGISTNGAHRH